MKLPFDNTYAKLPERLFAPARPTPAKAPRVLRVNDALARLLGLDPAALASSEGARVLSGTELPEGAEPIALAYAGHQFGHFVPQLGDGRAILLGEIVGGDGVRRDVQLKGAGRTRFSRNGDGRAALGPVLREYVVSEAMHALGVPTTRALAAVATGEPVLRQRAEPGAVLTRVAASHLRVGTFEYFAARDDREAIEALTAYAVARHHPDLEGSETPALGLLERVIDAHARLVSRWLGLGFVHGVMNTDNTSISGETLDYGPCAFLDEYDPKKRFSSIDRHGRYAFASQPRIALWNLSRFAETLLPLLSADEDEAVRLATARLEAFPRAFEDAHAATLRAKLGLETAREGDEALVGDLLARLAGSAVDHTLFFRHLSDAAEDPARDDAIAAMFDAEGAYREWAERWRARAAAEGAIPAEQARGMRAVNPAFIPRNHRIAQAIDAAEAGDLAPFEALVRVLERPYDDQPDAAHLAEPPAPEERVTETFCGT